MENKQSEDERKKERQRVLDQRIPPLKIVDNMSMEKLKEMAKDLHEKVKQVYAAKFDLEQRKKRQVYDVSNGVNYCWTVQFGSDSCFKFVVWKG